MLEKRQHLDTGRHGDVEVAQHVLRVLVLGGLAQEGQEPGGFLIAVSHLMNQGKWWGREKQMERGEQDETDGGKWGEGQIRTKERGKMNKGRKRRKREVEKERLKVLDRAAARLWLIQVDGRWGRGWRQSIGRRETERFTFTFTWPSVRSDRKWVTVRERERDSETDIQTGRQAG